MPTLEGMIEEAKKRGWQDAYCFRPHGTSLTEYHIGFGLRDWYQRGWDEGKKERGMERQIKA